MFSRFPEYGMWQLRVGTSRRVQIYTESVMHPIHNHHFNLESRVLLGRLLEEHFAENGKLIGAREIGEGETYSIPAERFHRIRVVSELPVITLVTELGPTTAPVRVISDDALRNAEGRREVGG